MGKVKGGASRRSEYRERGAFAGVPVAIVRSSTGHRDPATTSDATVAFEPSGLESDELSDAERGLLYATLGLRIAMDARNRDTPYRVLEPDDPIPISREDPELPAKSALAVLSADIAGYSRLVGLDELGTFHRVKALRAEILEPLVAKHAGRVIDYAGDGALIAFENAFDGAECALEIQRRLARHEHDVPAERRISLRLGLHFGEIIVDGSRIYGDSVNIAARLEELSAPGGLCLSDAVYREIVDRIAIVADYGGEPPLKNIAHGVGVWFWPNGVREGRSPSSPATVDRTSIAVLPFDDFGAAQDDRLADAVAEDLTTALARQSGLFVLARMCAFALKGKAVDASEAGRRLGVRYLVGGSVRRTGKRIRINVQLVRTDDKAHVWAGRFDSTVDDLLDLQDSIVESTLAAIEPRLARAEGACACLAPPGNESGLSVGSAVGACRTAARHGARHHAGLRRRHRRAHGDGSARAAGREGPGSCGRDRDS